MEVNIFKLKRFLCMVVVLGVTKFMYRLGFYSGELIIKAGYLKHSK